MNDLISRIAHHEGFRPKPYPDPLTGAEPWTFGHGLTYITEEESLMILHLRTPRIHDEISKKKPFFAHLPLEVQFVIIEMAFQMGVTGTLNFTQTWRHLEAKNYPQAAEEMLDSVWAKKQTHARAQTLATIMRNAKET